jgi:histidyl-tRNA synthetase
MSLVLNSIGDAADRPAYIAALREFFAPHVAHMNRDDARRYDTSPLRLLDSKELAAEGFMDAAPRSTDFLGEGAKAHWEELRGYLDQLGIPYRLDHRLVRGLDYYTRTVFEVHPAVEGAQSAVCAGGRYDGLMEQLGGKPTPGIGFAAGIERIILNLRRQNVDVAPAGPRPVVIAHRGPAAKAAAVRVAARLRAEGLCAVVAPERSLKAQLRYASALEASHAVLIGEAELEAGVVTVREMATSTQTQVQEAGVAGLLR